MELTYSPESERFIPEAAAPRRAAAVAGATSALVAAGGADALAGGAALAAPVRPDGGSHAVGVGVVVAVHLLIGYALISGLAQKVVDAVRAPVDVRLIQEIKPPPPPPVVKQIVKAVPKLTPPPPAYVPPPQVQIATPPPAPTITAVTQTVPVAPPPPVVVAAPPARPAPVQIALVCPNMVTPTLPRRAEQEGISGSVRAQVTIHAGKVVQVDILSSKPRGLFDSAVRTAMLQYGCQSTGGDDVVATQNFEFKVGE